MGYRSPHDFANPDFMGFSRYRERGQAKGPQTSQAHGEGPREGDDVEPPLVFCVLPGEVILEKGQSKRHIGRDFFPLGFEHSDCAGDIVGRDSHEKSVAHGAQNQSDRCHLSVQGPKVKILYDPDP